VQATTADQCGKQVATANELSDGGGGSTRSVEMVCLSSVCGRDRQTVKRRDKMR